jgi:hypothetical protein
MLGALSILFDDFWAFLDTDLILSCVFVAVEQLSSLTIELSDPPALCLLGLAFILAELRSA